MGPVITDFFCLDTERLAPMLHMHAVIKLQVTGFLPKFLYCSQFSPRANNASGYFPGYPEDPDLSPSYKLIKKKQREIYKERFFG